MIAGILFISGSEVFIVLLVVLLLFGSKKIPELAKGLGKGMKEFKRATEDIKKELHESTAEIRRSANEIQRDLDDVKGKLHEESSDLQKSVKSTLDTTYDPSRSPYDTAGNPYDESNPYEAGLSGVYREGEKATGEFDGIKQESGTSASMDNTPEAPGTEDRETDQVPEKNKKRGAASKGQKKKDITGQAPEKKESAGQTRKSANPSNQKRNPGKRAGTGEAAKRKPPAGKKQGEMTAKTSGKRDAAPGGSTNTVKNEGKPDANP
jgi:sec-independent protein translocase protein TatA